MTICFTLPYSSGGCEERRIKFDLLTAIIKGSLLASIKARRLMLTWLTLMQPRHAGALPFSSPALFFHPLTARICASVYMCLPMAHYLFCILADGKRANKIISFFLAVCCNQVNMWRRVVPPRSCGIYYFPLSHFISKFIFPL